MAKIPSMTSKSLFLSACLLILTLLSCNDKQAPKGEVAIETPEPTKVPETSTKSSAKTILCFGNSLTAGYGLKDEKDAWPSLLQAKLDSLKEDYKVVNAGLSGETTSGGLNRLDWVLKQDVDIFFLELGANDMLRGLDVNSTKENLENIIKKVRVKHPEIPIIVAGMMAPPNMGNEYAQAFNRIFPDICMKYKATLIPFLLDEVAGRPELNLPDGKHPNAQGQKIVLRNVWESVRLLI